MARAGARKLSSRRAARQKRKLWPLCACTASATLSSALNSRQIEVIWNERARPRCERAGMPRRVMSSPANLICPAEGRSSPASCATSVVLPAPLGPITACSSPSATASERRSVAVTPPKRLTISTVSSRRSAIAGGSGDKPVEAALGEQHREDEDWAEDRLPMDGDAAEHELEEEIGGGAENGTDQRPHAAEHDHDDELARARPRHVGRADVILAVGEKDAREPGDGAGDDEAGETV